jgi:hypothetical protein
VDINDVHVGIGAVTASCGSCKDNETSPCARLENRREYVDLFVIFITLSLLCTTTNHYQHIDGLSVKNKLILDKDMNLHLFNDGGSREVILVDLEDIEGLVASSV